jgi:hypothetical protein
MQKTILGNKSLDGISSGKLRRGVFAQTASICEKTPIYLLLVQDTAGSKKLKSHKKRIEK